MLLVGFLAGFALKAPIWPLHGWLPTVQAATPRSGALDAAALALKLGPYALLRFALPMCPLAISQHGNLLALLAVVGILYAALVGWVQRDAKRVLAHASVSHMGFALLGLFAPRRRPSRRLRGDALRDGLRRRGGGALPLRRARPGADRLARPPSRGRAGVGDAGALGLPGLLRDGERRAAGPLGLRRRVHGAAGSLQQHRGAGGIAWPFAALAALGVVLAAMYLLRLVAKLCFGELKLPEGVARPADLRTREVVMLAPLAFLCVFLGFFPQAFLGKSEQAIAAFVPATRAEVVADASSTPVDAVLISLPAAPGNPSPR